MYSVEIFILYFFVLRQIFLVGMKELHCNKHVYIYNS